jgi:hypothetical protein
VLACAPCAPPCARRHHTPHCPLLRAPQALAEEPDYDPALLQSAVALLNKQHAYGLADTLAALAQRVAKACAHQAKKQKRSLAALVSADAAAAAGGGAATADAVGAAAAGGSGMAADSAAVEAQIEALVARWRGGCGDGVPLSYEDAEAAYTQALTPLAVGVFDASVPGAYNSQFNAMAQQAEGARRVCALCVSGVLVSLRRLHAGWHVQCVQVRVCRSPHTTQPTSHARRPTPGTQATAARSSSAWAVSCATCAARRRCLLPRPPPALCARTQSGPTRCARCGRLAPCCLVGSDPTKPAMRMRRAHERACVPT